MKHIILIFTLISLLLTGCVRQEVVINGEVVAESGIEMLIYSVPIYETDCLSFNDTVRVNETGNFTLKLNIIRPAFISFSTPQPYKNFKLLVEPGNNIHLEISTDSLKISGTNEKGQILLNALPDPDFIDMEAGNLLKESSLTSIHSKIEDLKQTDLAKFENLMENKEISKTFFDLIQSDRNCYYASMEARVSSIKIYPLLSPDTKQFLLENGDDLLENLKNIYTQYPPGDEKLMHSSFWPEYAKNYISDYKQFSSEHFDFDKLKELYENKAINTFIINESKKYLSGKLLEFFQASYLTFVTLQQNYEKELISIFDQFEKDYPNSEYSAYIKPDIEKIISYYQLIEKPFAADCHIMPDSETINSLEEAVKPLKGKKIYIDVWASWCGPCKREFENNEALSKVLEKDNIQKLYISIDDEQRDQEWKNAIKYYDLKGTHIRANKELRDQLYKRFDKNAKEPYIQIPWYILIDENGVIIEEHAKSPSQLISEGKTS